MDWPGRARKEEMRATKGPLEPTSSEVQAGTIIGQNSLNLILN